MHVKKIYMYTNTHDCTCMSRPPYRACQPRFPALYAAYHYMRSRGWVPRSGVKCGVDFVAYRLGPDYCHSEYGIIVNSVCPPLATSHEQSTKLTPSQYSYHHACECGSMAGAVHPCRSWTSAQTLVRLMQNVKKDLIFCHVLLPRPTKSPQTRSESKSPITCLSSHGTKTLQGKAEEATTPTREVLDENPHPELQSFLLEEGEDGETDFDFSAPGSMTLEELGRAKVRCSLVKRWNEKQARGGRGGGGWM